MDARFCTQRVLAWLVCIVLCGAGKGWVTGARGAEGPSGILPLSTAPISASNSALPAPSSSSNVFTNAAMTALVFDHLQEQLRETRAALEKMRRDAQSREQQSTQYLAEQLARLEQRMSDQHVEKMKLTEALDQSSRRTLIYAGLFAGLAMLAMMITSWFQLRATGRLTQFVLGLPSTTRSSLSHVSIQTVPSESTAAKMAPETSRLLSAVDRLERRIQELESTSLQKRIELLPDSNGGTHSLHTPTEAPGSSAVPATPNIPFTSTPLTAHTQTTTPPSPSFPLSPATDRVAQNPEHKPASTTTASHSLSPSHSTSTTTSPTAPKTNGSQGHDPLSTPILDPKPEIATREVRISFGARQTQVDGILGKGNALLQLGQFDAALRCFDEACEKDPGYPEAWIKKGSALEKLEKLEEALHCYNRAITLDHTSTLAYLYKGGVCNRLERFDEALACYELALKHQPESPTSPASRPL